MAELVEQIDLVGFEYRQTDQMEALGSSLTYKFFYVLRKKVR
jgi:hypothetical protein